MQAIHPRPVF